MRQIRDLLLLPLLLTVLGCNNHRDTIIVNSTDCGLIRTDLLGTYTVSFSPVTADLFNCSDISFNGNTVTVTSTPLNFSGVQVYASAFNTGFTFTDSDDGLVAAVNRLRETREQLRPGQVRAQVQPFSWDAIARTLLAQATGDRRQATVPSHALSPTAYRLPPDNESRL